MPGLADVHALLALIAASAVIALAMLAVVIGHQVGSNLTANRRARADDEQRPAVMRAAIADQPDPSLVATGGPGRAVERVCYLVLCRVRGDARTRVAEILLRRGADRSEIRATYRRRAYLRARAAERLGLIASPPAERRLAELLRGDRSRRVRIVAARALGLTDSPGAATALLGVIRRDRFEYGGLEIATPRGKGTRTVPSGIVASALLALGTAALPELRAAATATARDEIARRALAIDLLGMLKDLASWKIVVSGLRSGYPTVRLAAARALGQLGMREPVWDLARCLSPDEVPAVRLTAAWALGRIRDPVTASALSHCLDDPDHLIAHSAAQALAVLGEAGHRQLAHAIRANQPGAAYAREALALASRPGSERPPVAQPPAASRPWRIGPPIAGLTR